MTYAEIQNRLQHALDRAAAAAAAGDRQATSDWLRTTRAMLADHGNDPALVDPAFEVLREALAAHTEIEEQGR